jgi:hypothetical protein
MISDWERRPVCGVGIVKEIRSTRRIPDTVPLCPPQIPHDLIWDRTRAAEVRNRRLTARTMERDIMQFGRWLPRFRKNLLYLSSNFIIILIVIVLPGNACMDLVGLGKHGSFPIQELSPSLLLPFLSAPSSPWGYACQTFPDI